MDIPVQIPPEQVDYILNIINIFGMFSFAVSGAAAAIKRKADLIGVLILALVASICGGIFRDILIGDLPPAIMRSHLPLFVASITGLVTYFAHSLIMRLGYPIDFFDAIGLGMYAVIGANKAFSYGISPLWSIAMGVITGVGGGVMRDVLLARVPTILRSEIYVTPAFLGASIMVCGREFFPDYANIFMVGGALFCSILR